MNSHDAHSPAVQDYLRAIYQLLEQHEGAGRNTTRVTTSQIAGWLDVRPASVTAMLQRMAAAEPALVDYHKSYGAHLTADGERAALAVVRNHRLLELYLHEKLGFGWDEVHEEADRLEHVIGDALVERLAESLGHPTHDPHGHAIPPADLSLERPPAVSLLSLGAGESAVVRFVRDEDAELLRYLDEVGLRPGAGVRVLAADLASGILAVAVDGGDAQPVPMSTAAHVFITTADNETV